MVRHAAVCICRYQIGPDGKTPRERYKGQSSSKPTFPFGERVLYKHTKTADIDKEDNRWAYGIFLGIVDNSNEYLMGTEAGVVKTPYMPKRLGKEEQWGMKWIKAIVGTPERPVPHSNSRGVPTYIHPDTGVPAGKEEKHIERKEPAEVWDEEPMEEETQSREPVSRAFYVKKYHIEKYGFTPSCRGCKSLMRGAANVQTHTQACREKIIKSMAEEEKAKTEKERQKKERKERIEEGSRRKEGNTEGRGVEEGTSTSASGSSLRAEDDYMSICPFYAEGAAQGVCTAPYWV